MANNIPTLKPLRSKCAKLDPEAWGEDTSHLESVEFMRWQICALAKDLLRDARLTRKEREVAEKVVAAFDYPSATEVCDERHF